MIKTLRYSESGQAVTEFGLVAPLMLLIVMAALTFGLMIYTKTLLVLAASQAARTGAFVYYDETLTDVQKGENIRKSALNILNAGIAGNSEDKKVELLPDPDNSIYSVKVSYKFKYIFPFLGDIFLDKNELNLSYTAYCMMQ